MKRLLTIFCLLPVLAMAQEGPQAPEEAMFVLPDVILDLGEPEFGDIESLQIDVESGDISADELLMLLPIPGPVDADDLAPSSDEGEADTADEGRNYALGLLLYGGNNFAYGGVISMQKLGSGWNGSFTTDYDSSNGMYVSGYTGGDQWKNSNLNLGFSYLSHEYKYPVDADLSVQLAQTGMQGYSSADSSQVLDSRLEVHLGHEVPLAGNISMGYANASYKDASGPVGSGANAFAFSLSGESLLPLTRSILYEIGLGWDGSFAYSDSYQQISPEVALIYRKGPESIWDDSVPELEITAAYTPVVGFASGFSQGGKLAAAYVSGVWAVSGEFGYETQLNDIAALWLDIPLVYRTSASAGGESLLTDRSLYAGLEGTWNGPDTLTVNASAEYRSWENRTVYLSDNSGFSGGLSLDSAADQRLRFSLDGAYQLAAGEALSVPLEAAVSVNLLSSYAMDPVVSALISTALVPASGRYSADLTIRQDFYSEYFPPEIRLDARYRILEQIWLETVINDPFGLFYSQGRPIGWNPDTGLLQEGFSAQAMIRLMF